MPVDVSELRHFSLDFPRPTGDAEQAFLAEILAGRGHGEAARRADGSPASFALLARRDPSFAGRYRAALNSMGRDLGVDGWPVEEAA